MTIITKGMGKVLTNILKPKMPKATKGVTDRNISSKKMFKTMQELKNKNGKK